jgi:hypothetical protein
VRSYKAGTIFRCPVPISGGVVTSSRQSFIRYPSGHDPGHRGTERFRQNDGNPTAPEAALQL